MHFKIGGDFFFLPSFFLSGFLLNQFQVGPQST